jgi:hypothetical protein
VWRRRRKAASAGLSAALYSVHHGLYSEAVVSSIASAVALAEVGLFRETVEYVQKAAKALYESAREVFEQVKVSLQRLAELFVEAVTRVLAWVDEHKAYLFLMAAGVVALSAALDMWGLVELEKLAYAASLTPFVAGLADAGGKAAERFKALAERYERWRVDENVINEVINAPLKGERPYEALLRLAESANLPRPLVELGNALAGMDEVVQDAAVVAALVLYKTLVKNAEAYREWAGWYGWARRLVDEQVFAVAAEEVEGLRGAQRRLEEAAEEVRRELNSVLALYALHSRDLYERLRPHLEVDVKKAEGLAKARVKELSKYSDINMGTRVYAALLSVARGGIYGHAATLLMMEGALADIVLSTPGGAYQKADRIAERRGEAVDPSRSGAAGWEERAASVLLRFLIGYGEADLKFRRVEKGNEKGFQVFRTFGGVEIPVGKLWIGKSTARFKVSKEGPRRLVEEAERTAPDLSGIKKIWQTLEWFATDVSFAGKWIEAATADTRQAAWYIALFGKPKSISGGASVTKEGVKPNVTMYWLRKRLDSIIAEEGEELKPLLGRSVKSWRELVNAIDWSWVLKRVEELVDELKPWISPERASDEEGEELVRRMLGELELLAHFAEARRGMNDSKWREERAKKLAKAVEALSGGRITGNHANELAKLIIRYAEQRAEKVRKRIGKLAGKLSGVSNKEVWGIVEFVLSDMYCLAKDCARDTVVRKFAAPALELIMLDKALNDNNESNRERARLIFGEMYATAVAGDGSVEPGKVKLTVGGELGGGAALLRLTTLHLLNQLLSDELKFNVRIYVNEGVYNITVSGNENAAKLKRFLAVTAPSAGGGYLSEKFEEFVKETRVEVRLDENSIRLTKKGRVVADLTISEVGITIKYKVYLSVNAIELHFRSADRGRAELAARLLRHVGVSAEVRKTEVGGRDRWCIEVSTDKLAAGHEELRNALAKVVRRAVENGWIDADKAERWLEKLESGLTLKEGWPKYNIQLTEGALVVRYETTNSDNITREAQRFRELGLVEGEHFSVKMPEGDSYGYVYIRREGLVYAAWLSEYGSGRQRELAAEFVKYILERAREAGEEVYEKAREIIEEGMSRGSLKLEGFEKEVEVDGKKHVVKVIDGGAEFKESESGNLLLRIRITAEVDGVKSEYTITFGRRGRYNAVEGRSTARADAPGGREADAERLAAVIKALTGKKPRIQKKSDGAIELVYGRAHLEGFKRYAELADAIEKWLEETRRR